MAGFFSEAFRERVRSANDIVDVIGSHVPLKRAGGSFVALCPFHKEKSPSFHVNPTRQIFHCFGCHKGGDVFSFIRDFESVDFPEAVRRLAERARIPLETEQGGLDAPQRHIKEQLLQIHEQITVRWQSALTTEASGQIARDYLARRQVSTDAVRLFRLGYAPDLWDDTVNWARSKGFDVELMEKAGLILRREGGGHYDRFRGRLMFPICDEQGRVIGFSGRVLTGDEKTAKYVNSPETPIFTKSKVFFGLDKSKRALLEARHAIVCEGQLDLIACFMSGVQNVVAPQGTAFTSDHARILRRYVEEVVLCFDSDEAGQNAAVRSLEHLLASGLAVRVAEVPSPHDPDSLIKANGAQAFRDVVTSAEGFFDWYLRRLVKQNDITTDKGRLGVLRSMADAVLRTGNAVLADTYAQKTALQLGVRPEAVRTEFRRQSGSRGPAEVPAEEPASDSPSALVRPNPLEYWLLRIVFTHEECVPWLEENLRMEWIQNATARELVRRRLQAWKEGTWTSLPGFLESLESPDLAGLLTEISAQDKAIDTPGTQLLDIATRLRNQFLDVELWALKNRAGQQQLSDEDRVQILQEQQRLRAAKKEELPKPEVN